MVTQNKVVLSLGSNQGNRLEQLEKAVQQIHDTVGTVIHFSAVYETPAWGFQSNAFYNCALLLHSSFSAEQLLDRILQTEQNLGRIRKKQSGYSARSIDIDIISYNQEIHKTEKLTVPHPFLQERRFVLQPATDLELEWTHPILKKTFQTLLKECKDNSSCVKIANLNLIL